MVVGSRQRSLKEMFGGGVNRVVSGDGRDVERVETAGRDEIAREAVDRGPHVDARGDNEGDNDDGNEGVFHGRGDDRLAWIDSRGNVPSTSTSKRARHSLVASILDREINSRLCPWSARWLWSRQMEMYGSNASVARLRLCGSLGLRERTTAAEVDGIGELLVVGCGGGHVLVSDVQRILETSRGGPGRSGEDVGDRKVEPGLHVRVGDAVHAVRWNPANQNEIGVLGRASGAGVLCTYDINRTRGEPSRKIGLQQCKARDVSYFPSSSSTGSGQYCMAVACERNGVMLYDARKSSTGKPVCVLKGDTQRHTGARCVSIVDHGRIVLAGGGRDLDGYLNMWDLRNVSGNVAVTFSAAPNKHEHLRRVCLKTQLGRVHGLIDESRFIPCTYPEFVLPDPASYHRVGIHLRCGWSAVLDLGQLELSHVHAPPARNAPSENWMDAMQEMDEAIMMRVAGDSGRVALPHEIVAGGMPSAESVRVNRRAANKDVIGGCWLGESFVVPSATMDRTVNIVDFSGPARPESTEVPGEDDLDDWVRDAPSAVQVGVTHDAVGVVRVPGDRRLPGGGFPALLSYGTDGTWNVLSC